MPSIGVNRDEAFAEFESVGVDEVRLRVGSNIYNPKFEKGALAQEWLRRKDLAASKEADRLRDEFNREQRDIARSAKNAAWAAAIAAIVAAIITAIAAVIAYKALKP